MGGRAARWLGSFRTARNRAVAGRFVQSLRSEYGAELAGHVLSSTGLDARIVRGKPLHVRHIRQAVGQADMLLGSVRTANAALGRTYGKSVAGESGLSLVRIKMNDIVRSSFPSRPTVGDLVSAEEIAAKVEEAVTAAGRGGRHFVTTEEAAHLLTEVVGGELRAAYQSAREGALAALSLDRPGSIGRQALRDAAAKHAPPLDVNAERLSADAQEVLAARFGAAITNDAVPAHLLRDGASLRALADEVMERFVVERAAAREALPALPVTDNERAALADQLLHDSTPAELVAALGGAYAKVAGDAVALATPLKGEDLESVLSSISSALSDALPGADDSGSAQSQDRLHRAAWRFLLAPADAAAKEAMATRLRAPDSPLRAIGDGAAWYREVFPGTEEAARTVPAGPPDYGERAVYPPASFATAARWAVLLDALAEVVGEGRGNGNAPPEAGSDALSDEAVTSLRNLGIAMPPPDRVGRANADVPISAPGLAAIRAELADHLASKADAPLRRGVLRQSVVDYERATYRIDGRTLPVDAEAVTDELRAFCTDATGELDESLLRNLSLVAYQAAPGCFVGTCLSAAHPDICVFDGMPDVVPDENSYNISRDAGGSVTVTCLRAGSVVGLDRVTDAGIQRMSLDPNASRLAFAVRFRLDSETHRPSLDDVQLSYALHPLPDLAEPISANLRDA